MVFVFFGFSPKQKHQKHQNKNILEVPGHHNLLHIFTVNLITSDPTVQTQLSERLEGRHAAVRSMGRCRSLNGVSDFLNWQSQLHYGDIQENGGETYVQLVF